jgi:hypothetical protein
MMKLHPFFNKRTLSQDPVSKRAKFADEKDERTVIPDDQDEQEALLNMDEQARAAFLSIKCAPGKTIALMAPPGAGKTTICMTLVTILAKTGINALILYYNKSMREDAYQRSKDKELTSSLKCQTIDSAANEVFRSLGGCLKQPGDNKYNTFYERYGSQAQQKLKIWNAFAETTEPCNEVVTADMCEWVYKCVTENKWWDYHTLRKLMLLRKLWSSVFHGYDLVIVDEAQDMNGCSRAGIIQASKETTQIYVGDINQMLYQGLGAENVFEINRCDFTEMHQLYATYRFGQDLCDYVNNKRYGQNKLVSRARHTTTIVKYKEGLLNGTCYTYLFHTNMDMLEKAAVTPGCQFEDLDKKVNAIIDQKRKRARRSDDQTIRLSSMDVEEGAMPYAPYNWDKFHRDKSRIECLLAKIKSHKVRKDCKHRIQFRTVHGFKGSEDEIVRLHSSLLTDEGFMTDQIRFVGHTRSRRMLVLDWIGEHS